MVKNRQLLSLLTIHHSLFTIHHSTAPPSRVLDVGLGGVAPHHSLTVEDRADLANRLFHHPNPARTVRVEAGCNWGEVNDALQAYGLAATGGFVSVREFKQFFERTRIGVHTCMRITQLLEALWDCK